jgi:hypothetical protein
MPQSHTLSVPDRSQAVHPASEDKSQTADAAKAAKERREETVSEPGGFANDPDDPTNPNEAIERHRRTLRP